MTSTFPNGFSLVNISLLLYLNIAMSIELVHSVTKISMPFPLTFIPSLCYTTKDPIRIKYSLNL